MKRPLFIVGFIYLTAMTVAFYVNYVAAIAVILVLSFAMMMIAGDKSRFARVTLTVLSAGMVALAVSVCFAIFRYAPIKSLDGSKISTTATIMSENHRGRINNYDIIADFSGMPILGTNNVKVMLTTFERLDAEVGDTIYASFNINSLRDATNNEMYYLSKGIMTTATLTDKATTLDKPNNRLLSAGIKAKNAMIIALDENVKNNRGGLISALLFGEGEGIDENVREFFSHSGISHILAVSGLHLAIVVNIAAAIFTLFRGEKRAAIASIIFVWIFVFFGGMGYSLIRSGIMFTIYFIGRIIGRQSDGLGSLGLAAIVVTTLNPYAISSLSMQLSFLATLGILVLAPIMENGFRKYIMGGKFSDNRAITAVIKILCITIAAQIPTLPISVFKFGIVSLISPLTNMLVTPIVPILIVSAMLTASFGAIGVLSVSSIFGSITTVLIEIVLNISSFLATVPFASVYVARSYLAIWFFFISLAIIWVYASKHNKKLSGYLVIALTFTLLIGITSNKIFDVNTVKVLNTEGSPSVAVVKNHRAVLLGIPETTSEAKRVLKRLDYYGVTDIDLVIASDPYEVTTSGAEHLFSTREISYIIAPEDDYAMEYLAMATNANLVGIKNMEIIMLDGVQASLVTDWGVNIRVNDESILKIFDDYDIIKGRNSDAVAVIDLSGTPYIKKNKGDLRYLAHFGGNGEFILR